MVEKAGDKTQAIREHNYIRIDTFIFILAGNKDNHKISCWFEIHQDPTIRTLSFGKITIDLLSETCCDPYLRT